MCHNQLQPYLVCDSVLASHLPPAWLQIASCMYCMFFMIYSCGYFWHCHCPHVCCRLLYCMLVLYVLMVYIRGAVHIQIAPLVIVIAPLGGPRSPILMSEWMYQTNRSTFCFKKIKSGGWGMAKKRFFSAKIFCFYELNLHVKCQNPRTTQTWEKVRTCEPSLRTILTRNVDILDQNIELQGSGKKGKVK